MKVLFVAVYFIASFEFTLTNEGPSSCAEILLQGNTQSGIYTIFPKPWYSIIPFQVYCDMETDGGGWTLFQKRDDYKYREDFYRNWQDYKIGFGDLNQEFWLGNEHLYFLTNQDHVTLRVDLEDFEGHTRKAEYSTFRINDEADNYRITVEGYTGDAGDGMGRANTQIFVSRDKNDVNECSSKFKGGWWYEKCHNANPNGEYLKGNHSSFANGVNWQPWHGYYYSLKRTEMKVRPNHFLPSKTKLQ